MAQGMKRLLILLVASLLSTTLLAAGGSVGAVDFQVVDLDLSDGIDSSFTLTPVFSNNGANVFFRHRTYLRADGSRFDLVDDLGVRPSFPTNALVGNLDPLGATNGGLTLIEDFLFYTD